ncbi:hypothetical protein KEM56_006514 [Ascosphaera pollenicola]|nr:hypothetical protein KEM56_006514 [Ascosphaera pollenicola]
MDSEKGGVKTTEGGGNDETVFESAETLSSFEDGQRNHEVENRSTNNGGDGNDGPVVEEEEARPASASDALHQVQSSASSHKLSRTKVIMIMGSLALATFLAALDMTIVTTALPTIVEHFNASESDYSWIGSAYLLASAASSPSWGKIRSLICGVSKSSQMLIGGRVVQGLGGGGLLSMVNICIGDLFSMRERSMMYAVIGIVWAIAGAIGPIFGGLFTQYATWRWCFYINLPADGVALVSIFFFLRIETPKTPFFEGICGIDWLGSMTSAGGTVMFLLGLNYGGSSFPWASATVICLIVFGIVTWALFMLIQAKIARYPISPPWLFTSRRTLAPFLVCFIHGFNYTGMTYFLPLYFQTVLGATPILSGVYLFPLVVSVAIGSMAIPPPLWIGMGFFLLGLGLYIDLPLGHQWAKIIIYQGIAGLGSGPNFQAPLIALQSQIRPADIATATSTFAFTRNMGSAISVVIGGVIMENVMRQKLPGIRDKLPADLYKQVEGSSPGAMASVVRALSKTEARAIQAVYKDSLKMVWVFFTAMCAVGFLSGFLIQKKSLDQKHKVTKTGLAAQKEAREERLKEKREKKARKEGKQQPEPDVETGVLETK